MFVPLAVQAALVSAATAAVVTLLVEYAAKPRLESRKDRIVEKYRSIRDLDRRLLSLVITSSDRNSVLRSELSEDIRAAITSSLDVASHVHSLKWTIVYQHLRHAWDICNKDWAGSRRGPVLLVYDAYVHLEMAHRAWGLPTIRWRRPLAYLTLKKFKPLPNHHPA